MRTISEIVKLLERNGFTNNTSDNITIEIRTTSTSYYGGKNDADMTAEVKGVFVCIDPYDCNSDYSSDMWNEYDKLISLIERHKSLCYRTINPTVHSIMIYLRKEWSEYELASKVVNDKLDEFWKYYHNAIKGESNKEKK